MNTQAKIREGESLHRGMTPKVEYFDVVTIGAGISGIGAAYNLKKSFPEKTFAVLEANSDFGGTWHTHRYPGVRSDSDLFTFGYKFKPWEGSPIATAKQIRDYLSEILEENDLGAHINYNTRVLSADWCEADNLWTIEARNTVTGDLRTITTAFIWMCHGYYDHRKGYTPDWLGMSDFAGEIIHPQEWHDDIDLCGKRVVVIGSGATAATIVPAIAETVEHVTMLQRSPTYFIPRPNRSELADTLRKLDVDPMWIHEIVRRDATRMGNEMMEQMLSKPKESRAALLATLSDLIGPDLVKEHFSPHYDPWRQRVAVIPDGDFFDAINSGKASVATDEIERFTKEGILLKSGKVLEADIVITATGFNMNVMGDVVFSLDGEPIDFTSTVTWRGMMFTKIPNFIWVFGYFRSSWTLRADLISEFTIRMLKHMYENNLKRVCPTLPDNVGDEDLQPFLDPDDFNPGYLLRSLHRLPKSGPGKEWRHSQDYWNERNEIPALPVAGSSLAYR